MPIETSGKVESINNVENSQGTPVPPRSDDYGHAGGTNADPSAGISETIDVPDRADTITVLAQGADNSFKVTISWENTSLAYSGDSTTDVDVERAINAPTATVEFSGSATTIDYDIYAR